MEETISALSYAEQAAGIRNRRRFRGPLVRGVGWVGFVGYVISVENAPTKRMGWLVGWLVVRWENHRFLGWFQVGLMGKIHHKAFLSIRWE